MPDDVQIPPTIEPLDEVGGRALVEAWRASGLSGAAFCRQHRLRAQRLHYWRERLGYPIKIIGEPRMSVPGASTAPEAGGFVQVVVSPPPTVSEVEIMVGEVVVRVRPGFDAGLLREVVRAMAAAG